MGYSLEIAKQLLRLLRSQKYRRYLEILMDDLNFHCVDLSCPSQPTFCLASKIHAHLLPSHSTSISQTLYVSNDDRLNHLYQAISTLRAGTTPRLSTDPVNDPRPGNCAKTLYNHLLTQRSPWVKENAFLEGGHPRSWHKRIVDSAAKQNPQITYTPGIA